MRLWTHIRSIDWRRAPRRMAQSRVVWASAILLLIYTVAGFLLAPYVIERSLPAVAHERLGQRASVGAVRINPFTLTLEASDFRLESGGDKPLLAFKRLFVDFELWNVFRAWTFADIALEGADLALQIDREGRLNLLDILDRLRPSEPDQPPPRLIVDHLRVAESRVGLTDLSGETRATAALTPVNFELFDLSTLGAQPGRYSLQARLPAGGTLTWKGTVSLQPIAATGEVAMKGMRLETVWRFLRDELNLGEPRGDLSIAGEYQFSYATGKFAFTVDALQAELAGLSLALHDEKTPLIAMKTIRVSDASFKLANRELVVKKALLAGGSLSAVVAEGGAVDWQRIAAQARATSAQPQPPERPSGAKPWHIRFNEIAVQKVALDYLDRTREPDLAVRTAALDGALTLDITTGAGATRVLADALRLSLAQIVVTTPGSQAPFVSAQSLSVSGGRVDTHARSARAQVVALQGGHVAVATGANGPEGLLQMLAAPTSTKATPTAAGSPWTVQIDRVGIEKIAVEYADASRTPALGVRVGELNGNFRLDVGGGAPSRVVAADLQLAIARVAVGAGAKDASAATLDAIRLSGGRIDTRQRLIIASGIEMTGGGARLETGRDGPRGLLQVFLPPAKRPEKLRRESTRADASWRYQVEAVALKRFDIAIADRSYEPAIAYDINVTSLTGRAIDSASRKPMRVAGALRIGGGTANLNGTVAQDFSQARARLEIARLGLEPLRPLLARHTTLELASGNLSATARVTWRRGDEPALIAHGEVGVDNVLVNNTSNGERFASWKALAADGLALTVLPTKLAVKDVRVSEPAGRIIIAKDRSLNITRVLREAPAGGSRQPAQPKTAAGTKPPPFEYDVARIRLENGTLDFADLSLVLPFSTQVQQLAGSIVGLSSDPQKRAQLNLRGQVDKYGEARADGTLIPRDPTQFLDIRARFNNVDMPLLSPYSATFAGRKVAAGKLSLVLEYKIVDSQLAGENRIALQDFVLGERVEAPNALDLPLDLAIALLKDSEGRITLAVPVRGDVDNPKFDYGVVIRSAIANAIGRVVTAPFRALAGLFGKRDVEEVRTVRFAPGSDRIAPAQREQLDALAKALKERPQLKVVVRGPYDPTRDGRQLRRAQARIAVAQASGVKLKPGEDPGPIAYGDASTQRALEALLAERGGRDAPRELEQSFASRTGRQPDRVNPVLGFFGRGSKDHEFYRAVFDRVAEFEALPDTAVRTLAASRAQAIVDTLLEAGVDRKRVQSGAITQVNAAAGAGITTALALDVIAGAS